jgi:dipeptidyl aminopeptidase/acylaminoacyl peptidase
MESKAFENYELAWSRSPMKYVQGATTPTMFIHGRWDNVTPYPEAINMYMALKSMGVESQLVVYPREGHGVRNQPMHTADYHQRALDWFDKYLK